MPTPDAGPASGWNDALRDALDGQPLTKSDRGRYPALAQVLDDLVEGTLYPGAPADERIQKALEEAEQLSHDRSARPRVELVEASRLRVTPIRWLWHGWLARGKVHVLAGQPGTGKTTLALDLAACITSGRAYPDQTAPRVRGRVVIWSGEDDPSDTLVPRLLAAGADLARVSIVGAVRGTGESRPFDPATDLPILAEECAALDDVVLVIVDPLVSAVAGDSHRNAEVRRALAPLVALAQDLDAAALGLSHYTKGTAGRDPLERVTGSLAFGALARVVLGTVRQAPQGDDDGGPHRYTLARAKSNIGPDTGGYAYTLAPAEPMAGITTCRIAWGEALSGSSRDLLAEVEPEASGTDAGAWLSELLASGPLPAREVYREGEEAGYSRNQIKRAKDRIGAKTVKDGMTGGWTWYHRLHEGITRPPEGIEGITLREPIPSIPSGPPSHPSAPPSGPAAIAEEAPPAPADVPAVTPQGYHGARPAAASSRDAILAESRLLGLIA